MGGVSSEESMVVVKQVFFSVIGGWSLAVCLRDGLRELVISVYQARSIFVQSKQ